MEERSEPGSKRLKVTERCPPELEVVFRSCNSPWLQFKLLQASPLQFLPLVPGAVNRRLTDGDKELISRWLDKSPDAWSPDFDPNFDSLRACAARNAPTALQFLLDITSENLNPQTLLSQAYFFDAVDVFRLFFDPSSKELLSPLFVMSDMFCGSVFPTRILSEFKEVKLSFQLRKRLQELFEAEVIEHIQENYDYDLNVLLISETYANCNLTIQLYSWQKLFKSLCKSNCLNDLTCQQMSWIKAFLPVASLPELAERITSDMDTGSWPVDSNCVAWFDSLCTAYGVPTGLLLQKIRAHRVSSLVELALYHTIPTEPLCEEYVTAAATLPLTWEQFLSFPPKNHESLILQALLSHPPPTKEDVSYRQVMHFVRPDAITRLLVNSNKHSSLLRLFVTFDLNLAQSDCPEIRTRLAINPLLLHAWLNCRFRFDAFTLSRKQEAQEWFIAFLKEHPHFHSDQLSRLLRCRTDFPDHDRFWERKRQEFPHTVIEVIRPNELRHIYVWPFDDFPK